VARALRTADPNRPAYNCITRPELQRILLTAAERTGVPIRLGTTINALETQGDHANIVLSTGEHASYDLVIGFDGIRSRVRELLFGEAPPIYVGQGVLRMPAERPSHLSSTSVFFGYGKKAGLIPLSHHGMYAWVVVNAPKKERINPRLFPQLMRSALSGFGGLMTLAKDQIREDSEIVYSAVEEVILPPPWYRGRAIVMGDAAHACGPHLGQGAAMAVEDAVVAAELFGGPDPIQHSLEDFMKRRFARTKFIQDQTRFHGARGQWTNPIKCFVRNKLVLPRVISSGWNAIDHALAAQI
jgi:2-polyprenyl-6-methoxyphenol hydroxylase-like FAD-dependent oxidoreductase